MTDQDEEIIEVMAEALYDNGITTRAMERQWRDLPLSIKEAYRADAHAALDALRVAGMEVVSRAGIENARNEIEAVLDAIRSKPPRNKQEVPVRWIANRLRPALAMLAAHTDTAPSTDNWIIRGPWENFPGRGQHSGVPPEQAIEILMGHDTTGFEVVRNLGSALLRKARYRLLYYQTADGERRPLFWRSRLERPDDAVAVSDTAPDGEG